MPARHPYRASGLVQSRLRQIPGARLLPTPLTGADGSLLIKSVIKSNSGARNSRSGRHTRIPTGAGLAGPAVASCPKRTSRTGGALVVDAFFMGAAFMGAADNPVGHDTIFKW